MASELCTCTGYPEYCACGVARLEYELTAARAALEPVRCRRRVGDPCVLNKITVPADWCTPCRAAIARLRG